MAKKTKKEEVVEKDTPELKASGKPEAVEAPKTKTVMRMLGGRLREVEVPE